MRGIWEAKETGLPIVLLVAGALALVMVIGWPGAHLGMAVAKGQHGHSDDHAKSDDHGHGSASSSAGAETFSPDEALARLQDGNARFVEGRSKHPNLNEERLQDTARNGQHPFATIIGCSDSRAPIEAIFDVGVGDLFIIRVAGNICAPAELGSIEYGVDHLNTPLLVILGHTGCGAVTAAVTDAELHGNLPELISYIRPAVEKTEKEYPRLQGKELIPLAITANVWNSVEQLFVKSDATRQRVADGKLQIVGAIYDLDSGNVRWLGEHPEQDSLLEGPAADDAHEEDIDDDNHEEANLDEDHEEAGLDEAHEDVIHDDHHEEPIHDEDQEEPIDDEDQEEPIHEDDQEEAVHDDDQEEEDHDDEQEEDDHHPGH